MELQKMLQKFGIQLTKTGSSPMNSAGKKWLQIILARQRGSMVLEGVNIAKLQQEFLSGIQVKK